MRGRVLSEAQSSFVIGVNDDRYASYGMHIFGVCSKNDMIKATASYSNARPTDRARACVIASIAQQCGGRDMATQAATRAGMARRALRNGPVACNYSARKLAAAMVYLQM